MAQYKVPQDVEADDKLIGPFSFRQFVYLLIAGGLTALAVLLFQLLPLLVLIPLPPILLFLALALPLKKDQPMETYLAAIVMYYLKPHNRIWTPGQRESTIRITAPKVVEEVRTRELSGEEATHRLSFLASIVDTEGRAIKGVVNTNSSMREDLVAEANATVDMFDDYQTTNLNQAIDRNQAEVHNEAIKGMKEAISNSENEEVEEATIKNSREQFRTEKPEERPALERAEKKEDKKAPGAELPKKTNTESVKPSIIELANNPDFSVATIAKEANKIKRKEMEGEVFISLH